MAPPRLTYILILVLTTFVNSFSLCTDEFSLQVVQTRGIRTKCAAEPPYFTKLRFVFALAAWPHIKGDAVLGLSAQFMPVFVHRSRSGDADSGPSVRSCRCLCTGHARDAHRCLVHWSRS